MSKNLFNTIQVKKPKKNVFDLSHDVKLSFNMGELVPVCCLEAVPGDKFKISCESLVRFAPLIAPVMHRFDLSIHYFFVPYRILWNWNADSNGGWEQFITGNTLEGPSGPTTEPSFPYIQYRHTAASGFSAFTPLMDYLGLPIPDAANAYSEKVSALPFAAYQKIYADYYRDENLIADDFTWMLQGGDNTNNMVSAGGLVLKIRAWEHDYFTSCLPWAQKGAAVELPLGRVVLDDTNIPTPGRFRKASDYTTQAAAGAISANVAGGVPVDVIPDTLVYDPNGSLVVGSTTINDLRRAYRLQEWLEKNARGGTRYNESVYAHFGVRSPDQRLQRPEYIIGTKSPVIISEVLNTTGTNDLPQGNMSGHGISVASGGYGSYFCQEHGYIMGIMSLTPKTAYQQGIPRHFLKGLDLAPQDETFTTGGRFDFYWPEFANIGEQSILNRELYAFDAGAAQTFGYLPRYAEYKYEPSRVAGDFRTTLDTWHEGRIFGTAPSLNQAFVECVPDTRIFAVTDADTQHIYAHVLNKITAIRPMPKFGTPTF